MFLTGEIKRSSSYYFTSKTKPPNYSEGNVSNIAIITIGTIIQLHLSYNFDTNALHELLYVIKKTVFSKYFLWKNISYVNKMKIYIRSQ